MRGNGAISTRRIGRVLVDDGLAWILAALAAAGSFTHIRDLAIRSGEHGWMANAIAVCIDLMCVMAVRERKRDERLGRNTGRLSWPTVVLTLGIFLTIAANLAGAQPTAWGWIVAATPAGTFLIAVSMIERRACHPDRSAKTSPSATPQTTDTQQIDVRLTPGANRGSLPGPPTGRNGSHSRSGDMSADTAADRSKRRPRPADIEVRARTVLTQRPGVTGADLGRHWASPKGTDAVCVTGSAPASNVSRERTGAGPKPIRLPPASCASGPRDQSAPLQP